MCSASLVNTWLGRPHVFRLCARFSKYIHALAADRQFGESSEVGIYKLRLRTARLTLVPVSVFVPFVTKRVLCQ